MDPIEKANVLIEALPYLQAFRGMTFVIKMGGSAMEDPDLVARVMRDIVFLEVAGINPIVVHGGGKAISAAMEAAGLEAKFVGGFRVTTDEAIDIVARVLSEEINPGLVRMIRDFGGKAVGIPGNDVFLGEKIKGTDADGIRVDLGRVGEVVGCQLAHMDAAHQAGIVPVISPLAAELATVSFQSPALPVVCNFGASLVSDAAEIRSMLENQVTGSVRWTESIQLLIARGHRSFLELGPGKVVAGLVSKIDKEVTVHSVEDLTSLEAAVEALS